MSNTPINQFAIDNYKETFVFLQQMTAKVLFGGSTINDLTKRQEKAEREVRRTH